MSGKKNLPRGIDKIAGGYRVRIYVDYKQHHIGLFSTLGDAKAALAIAEGQKARGTFVPPGVRRAQVKALREQERAERMTVRAWAGVWLEGLTDAGRSPGTIRSYRSTLAAHVLDPLGDLNLKDVTPEHIDAVIESARGTGRAASRSAARNVARTLRAMFNAAITAEAGGLETNPVTVKISKGTTTGGHDIQERTASPEQVRELTALMPDHLALAVPLAAWLALRQGELLGLQRRDFINLEGKAPQVRIERQWHSKLSPPDYAEPKAGSRRTIHIPAQVAKMITDHLARYVDDTPTAPLFPSTHNRARPLGQSALDRYWRAARDKVKPGMRFHDLRHTGLTFYAQQGATLKELMRRGGHTDIKAAMVYQEAAAERDRALTAKLDAAIGGEET